MFEEFKDKLSHVLVVNIATVSGKLNECKQRLLPDYKCLGWRLKLTREK